MKSNWRKVLGEKVDPNNDFNFEAINLVIEISSSKDKIGGDPTSTTVKYRYGSTGKWNYLVDADSGEQAQLATVIPYKIKRILTAFGLPLSKEDKEIEGITNE